MKKLFVFFTTLFLMASSLFISNANASGYMLNEYSVTSLGRAFAGLGGVGDDLSAIASNPAGLSLFDRTIGAQVGVTVITLNGNFNGTVTSLNGKENGKARVEIQEAVPNFFAAYSINDWIKVGLGVYVPFGLGTEYAESSIVRYSAIKSDLQVIEIAPSISFNLWKGLSVGATVDIQHGQAELTQKVATPTGNEIYPIATLDTKVKGDAWSAGATIGIMYDFGETSIGDTSRIGLSYKSQVKHHLLGKIEKSNVNPAILSQIIAGKSNGIADMYLPNVVTLSAYHKFNAPVALSATLRYIQWSIFDSLEIEGSGLPAAHYNWRDTISAHIGVDYFAHEAVSLRAGFAYDMTPIRDAAHRTARIPDNDRYMLSLGLSAMPHKNWQIDVGYTHMFIAESSINNTHAGVNVNGTYNYDMLSYLIGVQVQYKF